MKKEYRLLIAVIFLSLASCSDRVKEMKPQHKDITEMVFASGMLEADNKYNLTAQTDGYLVRVNFEEGSMVHKNQVMAVIDNDQNVINAESASQLDDIARENSLSSAPALQQIKANITAAAAKVELDAQQRERFRLLYENNSVSRIEYENAKLNLISSEALLNSLEQQYRNQRVSAKQQEVVQRYASRVHQVLRKQNLLTAINSGKVYAKQKQLGDYVRKGDVIAIIGNPQVIYAKLNVDETGMSRIREGQTAIIKLNTNSDKVYRATIRKILPAFDELSRSFIIKAYFSEIPDFKIIGTQLEANIIIGNKKNALVIPSAYLDYGNKVMLKEGQKVVSVEPGIISSEWVEILSGLNTRQTIIITEH